MTARPRFRHEEDGTSEAVWLTDGRWGSVPSLDVAATAARHPDVLVVAAHPDDETLGAGGLVAELAEAGSSVRVLTATSGEASHPGLAGDAASRLASRRRAEADHAVAALAAGVTVTYLDIPDGTVADQETRLVEEIAQRCTPDTLVVAPWTGDAHPDHESAGRAGALAAARTGAAAVFYPVWLWHWGGPEDLPWPEAVVLEQSASTAWRKRAALGEFRSQQEAWDVTGPGAGAAPMLGPRVLDRAHRLVETYLDPDGVLPLTADDEGWRSARSATLDAMYDGGEDPWAVRSSFYESRRKALVLAALGRERYGRVLEVGCADGHLTRELVARADHVTALDTSPRAVAATRAAVPSAEVGLGAAPDALEPAGADLLVLAEVGYFLRPRELVATLRIARQVLDDGGEVLLCHWQHPTNDIPLDGALVHEQASSVLGEPAVRVVDPDVTVEVWTTGDSAAVREGRV